MRYQTASPACMPASNGKKPKMISKKDEAHENGRILNGGDFLEGKSVRLKGGSSAVHNGNTHKELEYLNSPSDQVSEDGKSSQEIQVSKKRVFEGTGDLLLQWGQNKRSRGYRADYNRNVVEETSVKERKVIRIDRRTVRNEKPSASAQNPSAVHSRSTPLRPCTPVHDPSTSGFIHSRIRLCVCKSGQGVIIGVENCTMPVDSHVLQFTMLLPPIVSVCTCNFYLG